MDNIIDKVKLESTGEVYDIVGRKPSELETLAAAIESLTNSFNALSVKVDKIYYDRFPDEKPQDGSGSGSGSGTTEP